MGEKPISKISLPLVFLAVVGWALQMSIVSPQAVQEEVVGADPFWREPYALESKQIVPFVPTPQTVVDRMLEMAEVGGGDVVYDLGSGDGRIVITAARRYGVKAIGFEIDPRLVSESRQRIRTERLEHLAEIRQQDILTVDLTPATVVTMYLFPSVNLMLRPNIKSQLRPGSRVVSHAFDMGDWKPLKSEYVKNVAGRDRLIHVWRVDNETSRPEESHPAARN